MREEQMKFLGIQRSKIIKFITLEKIRINQKMALFQQQHMKIKKDKKDKKEEKKDTIDLTTGIKINERVEEYLTTWRSKDDSTSFQ